MSHDSDNVEWPQEAGERGALPKEMQPPRELEERVVGTLMSRGLIAAQEKPVARPIAWRAVCASLAAAACTALVAIGFFLGRISGDVTPAPVTALTGSADDLYALLLYETAGYDRPTRAEAMTRYGEYSVWVAEARRRDQFVTGEDLEADRGWRVMPSHEGPMVEEATSVAEDAPLSGIFFIRAKDARHALELARELPHIKHGGSVLVQKTIPTDTPPEPG